MHLCRGWVFRSLCPSLTSPGGIIGSRLQQRHPPHIRPSVQSPLLYAPMHARCRPQLPPASHPIRPCVLKIPLHDYHATHLVRTLLKLHKLAPRESPSSSSQSPPCAPLITVTGLQIHLCLRSALPLYKRPNNSLPALAPRGTNAHSIFHVRQGTFLVTK